MNWGHRALFAVVTTVGLVMTSLPSVAADPAKSDTRAEEPLLILVHGYGSPETEDCDKTWGKAIDYFENDQGMDRDSIQTIGYYTNKKGTDDHCDKDIGGFDNEQGIQYIAQRLAHHIESTQRPVNIVAHSMGGLITRVALLGSANRWTDKYDFPDEKLHNVENVVTLDTPHQGISQASKHTSTNWRQMDYPESDFMRVLHADKHELDKGWAEGTDWSFVGSSEDTTVSYDSGIDEGNPANQKYGYQEDEDDGDTVTHSAARELSTGDYNLIYWNSDEGGSHTNNGWAPLETAYNAVTQGKHDGQP